MRLARTSGTADRRTGYFWHPKDAMLDFVEADLQTAPAIALGGLKRTGECKRSAVSHVLLNAVLDFDRQLASRAG